MSTNQLDQLNQYISRVMARLDQADQLMKQGRPYSALKALRSVVTMLPESPTGWVSEIDTVDQIQSNRPGKAYRNYEIIAKRNQAARELYEKYEPEIWAYLHKEGYFTLSGNTSKGTQIMNTELNTDGVEVLDDEI